MPDHSSDPTPATRAEARAGEGHALSGAGARGVTSVGASGVDSEASSRSLAELFDRQAQSAEGDRATDAAATAATPPRRPRTDWRLGGRSVRAWREWLLAGGLLSLGGAVLIASAIELVWQTPWAAAAALLVVWLGMLFPAIWAIARSRPAGLFRFRGLDLLYGVALGGLLRLVQGWLDVVLGATGALPSYPLVNGALPAGWWLTDLVGPVLVAPIVEGLFFCAVILVAMYTVLRRPAGKPAAGVVAVLASAGLFTIAHGLLLPQDAATAASTALLGLVCAALAVLSGRLWGAVLVHLCYNASFVMLALAGTFLR